MRANNKKFNRPSSQELTSKACTRAMLVADDPWVKVWGTAKVSRRQAHESLSPNEWTDITLNFQCTAHRDYWKFHKSANVPGSFNCLGLDVVSSLVDLGAKSFLGQAVARPVKLRKLKAQLC